MVAVAAIGGTLGLMQYDPLLGFALGALVFQPMVWTATVMHLRKRDGTPSSAGDLMVIYTSAFTIGLIQWILVAGAAATTFQYVQLIYRGGSPGLLHAPSAVIGGLIYVLTAVWTNTLLRSAFVFPSVHESDQSTWPRARGAALGGPLDADSRSAYPRTEASAVSSRTDRALGKASRMRTRKGRGQRWTIAQLMVWIAVAGLFCALCGFSAFGAIVLAILIFPPYVWMRTIFARLNKRRIASSFEDRALVYFSALGSSLMIWVIFMIGFVIGLTAGRLLAIIAAVPLSQVSPGLVECATGFIAACAGVLLTFGYFDRQLYSVVKADREPWVRPLRMPPDPTGIRFLDEQAVSPASTDQEPIRIES